jgi:acyl transferase domain-containing protein/NAD(P)H-dependent flavin oxidoreductase YrpB (nitropropane dioxygenase family)/NADP-dependent 3-hydroxy acid dehydrogenase YdfG
MPSRAGSGRNFTLAALTPPDLADSAIAIAASRAGAIGLLDLTGAAAADRRRALADLVRYGRARRLGVRADPDADLDGLPDAIGWAILADVELGDLEAALAALHARGLQVYVEVVDTGEATRAEQLGADGLVAKGSESGGRVGEETAFVLAQRIVPAATVPVWVQGGIGPHTVAACRLAGAAGAVLDAQLWLARESALPQTARTAIETMSGSETAVLGTWRVYAPPGPAKAREVPAGRRALYDRRGWDPDRDLLTLGQDASLAATLAAEHTTVGGIITALADAAESRPAQAAPLGPDSPLARDHGTRLPIVQGPMTRVSDRAAFAAAVAGAGALPFLALALMEADDVDVLLQQTAAELGDRPWGVGILGFVPPHVRAAQLEVIERRPPPFALIAGGRPDQARALEAHGIRTYLHVPSPALLELFARDGARRFVLEGRECGGHVGPRSSLVLWSQAVDALVRTLGDDELAHCRVLLAGGIHDARSAAMAATVAAPLAARGAAVGVLMGTAYLFCEETVAAGAIVPGFQEQALSCDSTVLLESGPGHATRCAPTPFADAFARERARLQDAGAPGPPMREALERLSLGRLRRAAKGVDRIGTPDTKGAAPPLAEVDEAGQAEGGMYMLGQVAALRSRTTTLAALHEDVSVGAARLLAHARGPRPERRRQRPDDVAIIGMACVLPGAPELASYWRNILGRVDAITEVPAARFDWRRLYEEEGDGPDAISSRWGGFIDDVVFDPVRWGMPPASLASIEPMQLLTLHVAAAALSDAGYERRRFAREQTSVILGVGGGIADLGHRYALRSGLPLLLDDPPAAATGQLPEWTEDSFAGILLNVAAGRVANRLDLGGVNYTVDAACASSLAAISLAVRELETGTSDMVVAGGADTVQNSFGYLCFSKTGALSRSGRCRTFDDDADGIVISEGVAMVVLKRRADAERDGDRIYAVVRAVAGSSDGRAKGLTAPRPEGQLRALDRAYDRAGFSPATVGLVEAHGTGTVAGDRAEVRTLCTSFGAAGAARGACAIGSVKSMIGHTKCTAGVAGLIKTALALHHKVLPPTINVERPNQRIGFADGPFHVNTETRPWVHAGPHPRRAGVSAFGFGGTNFHAVLEEHTDAFLDADAPCPLDDWPAELCVFSGSDRAALLAHVRQVAAGLAAGARPRLADLAAALWRAADDGPRLAIVAGSLEELAARLDTAAGALADAPRAAIDEPGTQFSERPLAPDGHVALLFPGQGSQHCDMTRDLAVAFGEVRGAYEAADRVLGERLPQPLSGYVFPPPRFDAAERDARETELRDTMIAQPALGAAELGILRLLQTLGVRASVVAGHSYGELVALHAAGALGADDLLRLSAARGRAIVEACAGRDLGTMAAAGAGADSVAGVLAGADELTLANLNSPEQTVVSGPVAAIEEGIERLRAAGIAARRLPVACAFHSPLMAPARSRFREALAATPLTAPDRPVYANVSGRPHVRDAAAIAASLDAQLVSPVHFAETIEGMYAEGARVFVEAGPRGVLTGLVRQILGERPHVAVAVAGPAPHGLSALVHALAPLVAHGAAHDLSRLFARRTGTATLDELLTPGVAAPLPTTAVLVNGGSIRRPDAPAVAALSPVRVAAAPEPESAPPAAGPDAVMARFQGLMSSFLADQRAVMAGYLGDTDAPEHSQLARCVPHAVPIGPPAGSPLLGDGVAIILDDGTGVAPALARRLRALGTRTEILGGDLDEEAALAAAVERIRAEHGAVSGVIQLRALAHAPDWDELRGEAASRHLADRVTSLFRVVRAVGGDLRSIRGSAVVAATAMGGGCGTAGAAPAGFDPAQGAVGGLVKAIGAEWPGVAAKVVDLDAADAETQAERIVAELGAHDGEAEVGYRGGERLGVRIRPASRGVAATPLGPESVVLLTGGARGITAEAAKAIAARARCTLVLVGRTPAPEGPEPSDTASLPDAPSLRGALAARNGADPATIEARVRETLRAREVRATLAAIEAAGGRAELHVCDVRDEVAFGALIEDVYARHGRIDVAIHGAGVLDDRSLARKDPTAFADVLATKVTGALVLARHLRPASLRRLVLFASIAGTFGNAGQTDYAAANEWLSKLAVSLGPRFGDRVTAIAWGPWAATGMVSDAVATAFARRGIEAIDVPSGCAALLAELEHDVSDPVVVLGNGPWLGSTLSVTLDPSAPYLDQHRLDGRPVLPAAMALELMLQAAGRLGGASRAVEDLQILHGVAVDGQPLPIRVTASEAAVTLEDPPSATTHYRARLRPAGPSLPPPAPLRGSEPFPLELAEAQDRWLFHGPALRGIASIEAFGADGIDATLTASNPAALGVTGDWTLDPVVVDSAFQLVILWARARLDRTPLPARFGRVDGCISLPAGTPVSCRLRVRSRLDDRLLDVSITLLDPHGGVLAVLDDVEFGCSTELNRLSTQRALAVAP